MKKRAGQWWINFKNTPQVNSAISEIKPIKFGKLNKSFENSLGE